MSSDPIHDVPVGLQPVLQDLSETPRVDPLKRLIERYPPKPPPPRTKGKVDAKALISQLPAETLLWLQGPHREYVQVPLPTNESTKPGEARRPARGPGSGRWGRTPTTSRSIPNID